VLELNGAPADEWQAVERQVVADLHTHAAPAAEVARVNRHIQAVQRHAVPGGNRLCTIVRSLFDVGGAGDKRTGACGFDGNPGHFAVGAGNETDGRYQK